MESFVDCQFLKELKFLPFIPPPYCRKTEKNVDHNQSPSLHMTASDPSKVLFLCETLSDNSSKTLEVKINRYLMNHTNSNLSFLIHLLPSCREAVVQTLGTQELETSLRVPVLPEVIKEMICCKKGTLKCGEALDTHIAFIFEKLFHDLNFKYTVVPILKRQAIYPCCTQNIHPALLVCFINSKEHEDFVTKIANEVFRYCLPVLLNIMEAEEERRRNFQFKTLLTTIRKLIMSLQNPNELNRIFINECKKLTHARKCSIYLVNEEDIKSMSKIFNASIVTKNLVKSTKKFVIPDHVTKTGNILNINKSARHPLVNSSLTEATGFKTENVLCFPLVNDNDIIGAVQLCNKLGEDFNQFDEEIVKYVGTFYGLTISQSLKHANLENCIIRHQICDDIMTYQKRLSEEEVAKKVLCPLIHRYNNFDSFSFSPREVVEEETVCFVLKMFEDLDFFTQFAIKKHTLTRFVLLVKKESRDVPYHNWMHLFSTVHFGYLCLKNLHLVEKGYITPLEAVVYFISCLCHDVDYRGSNSWFQEKSNNSLASLYSSPGSVFERHRLSQVFRLLNSENCNILEVFDRKEYTLAVNLMKDLMLALDMVTHFKFHKKQYDMIKNGYDRDNPEHRYIFTSLLITCADLSDFTKDWTLVKTVAAQVYEEFITIGDLEKEVNQASLKISDVDHALFPNLQIEFLKQVCLPPFKLLTNMFHVLKILVSNMKSSIVHWEVSKRIFEKVGLEDLDFTIFLLSETFDKDMEVTMKLLSKDEHFQE